MTRTPLPSVWSAPCALGGGLLLNRRTDARSMRIRPLLLVAVIAYALVALVLRANDIPMPGWFAAILVTVSLALVCSRLVPRQVSGTSRASNM